MKIFLKNFKNQWNPKSPHKHVVLYGQNTAPISLLRHHMEEGLRTHGLTETLTLEAKECLATPSLLFEPLTTQDLFAPQKHCLIHLQGATDKAMGLLEELLSYAHVTLLVEALGLPTSSKIIAWAQRHSALMAVPLYHDDTPLQDWAPFPITPTQARTLQALCAQTHESLEHMFQKLQDFVEPATTLTPELFHDFLTLYEDVESVAGYVGEAMQRADANPIGLSRLLFSDLYRHLKPNAPSWGKQHALFEHVNTLPPQAQARILGHFLTSETQSMQHTPMPLCAAFTPTLVYHIEYQMRSGRLHSTLNPTEIDDVLSIRFCS